MESKEPNGNKKSDLSKKSKNSNKEVVVVEKVKRKPRKWKDPDAPKRPLGPYFYYFKENNSRIRELHTDCNQKIIVSKIAQQWKELTGEQKKPYEELSKTDKQRYLREKESYEIRVTKAAEDAKEEIKWGNNNDNHGSRKGKYGAKNNQNEHTRSKGQKTDESFSPRNEKEIRLKDVLGSDQVSFASESEYLHAYSPPSLSIWDSREVQEARIIDQRILFDKNYLGQNQGQFNEGN